ncbi:MAG: RnfABCDGE type electron transport complex subunit B [Clostridia bacterium]|nr:RnfABCDGE type electron transport complex subunit B [Clostridia bacterium]
MGIKEIMLAFVSFAVMGGILGVILAFAGKKFAVKTDERVEEIKNLLPGANCGGCGYAGCSALAEAIVKGEANPNSCTGTDPSVNKKIASIMGVELDHRVRMRAQVMCSGTFNHSKIKYKYEGIDDCIAAARLGGGLKECPNACIGLGTCTQYCKFGAISVKNGVAVVDYHKCVGCGVCVTHCPKSVIHLVPYDSKHWVGCSSKDKGASVRKYCDVGCFGCSLCQKNCETGAITVNSNVASIDYEKCNGCDKCVDVCPRHIIWSANKQKNGLFITREKPQIIKEQ